MIYTVLNFSGIAIAHDDLPDGVTPSNAIPGKHPLGHRWTGAEFVPVTPPPPPPITSITPRQARLALLQAGLLDQVQGAFAQLPEEHRAPAAIEWEYATSVERSSPLVSALGPMLGLTEEQIDGLFAVGATL